MQNNQLPTLADLTLDVEQAYKQDQFNLLMSEPPPPQWIKEHPYISGWKYLPIDKVEYLLKKIFKNYSIEITGQGTAFNGIWVSVRVHYTHPLTGEKGYNDGIGAMQLQTKKGTSPAQLENVNNGAVSMAFPIAKTLAIKDACDMFGALFGANLNRKDIIPYKTDKNLEADWDSLRELFELKKEHLKSEDIEYCERIINNQETNSYKKLIKKLKSL